MQGSTLRALTLWASVCVYACLPLMAAGADRPFAFYAPDLKALPGSPKVW